MKKVDVLSLDGKHLRVFLTVFDKQSVTAAAEILGTSQSAVSHSLDRLRACIGDQLFVKHGRGIAPTHAASTLAPKMQKILSEIEGLSLQSVYDPTQDFATFTIATNVTELLPILMAVEREIRSVSRDISLRFIELGARTNALEMLSSGSADIAIAASIGPYPFELSVERLYQDELVCFHDHSRRSTPLTIESYCAARHGILDFGGTNKSIVDAALDSGGFSRRVFLSASNSYALANFMRGSDVLATLPKRLHTTAFEDFYVSMPPFSLPLVRYDLVWHRRMRDSLRHTWFRDQIRKTAREFDVVKDATSVENILPM